MKRRYSNTVGRKFLEDGTAKEFPGNTVICHIPQDSPQFQYLLKMREILLSQPWAWKFSFLPPSSLHMTVFGGVCNSNRELSYWPKTLSLVDPLEKVDNLFIDKWSKIARPQSFAMNALEVTIFRTISIQLEP